MKPLLLCLALVASILGLHAEKIPYSPPNSELRRLPANADGRAYQLYVGLPASYASSPDKKYPVVYVTDGYWDFDKIFTIHGSLTYDKVVPEFITIGLGYVGENLNYGQMRAWELLPIKRDNTDNSGNADKFIKSLREVIIPYVEKEFRVDSSYRVLGGASLGGLFTLYTMYTEPDLFQGYVAVTPAAVVGDDWLLGYEEKFAKSGRAINARLFVTGGGNESPNFLGGIIRYNHRVQKGKYLKGEYAFRIVEGERHGGVQVESYVRGLRHVFAPLAPEKGPQDRP